MSGSIKVVAQLGLTGLPWHKDDKNSPAVVNLQGSVSSLSSLVSLFSLSSLEQNGCLTLLVIIVIIASKSATFHLATLQRNWRRDNHNLTLTTSNTPQPWIPSLLQSAVCPLEHLRMPLATHSFHRQTYTHALLLKHGSILANCVMKPIMSFVDHLLNEEGVNLEHIISKAKKLSTSGLHLTKWSRQLRGKQGLMKYVVVNTCYK